ncbi:protein of unknown function [Blastococcus saxobsidens DD2]|uniref:Uncharacterized protein n=1 Tax=Blastococcus saxobsidens (strain DD2) TaxID=1146883 RepID=H6RJ34_BLASD|nr:protein of unknown function [Blastococcus saxobsidens DD2]
MDVSWRQRPRRKCFGWAGGGGLRRGTCGQGGHDRNGHHRAGGHRRTEGTAATRRDVAVHGNLQESV